MLKRLFYISIVFVLGFIASFTGLKYFDKGDLEVVNISNLAESEINKIFGNKNEIIGFLPFWLLSSAASDYSSYINNLAIFSLIMDKDGSIKKYDKPTEGEPGYFSLVNGKFDDSIRNAKDKNTKLSIVVFSGKDEDIDTMLNDPKSAAIKLVSDVVPIANEHGFDEINLDIEKVSDATPEARLKFVEFVKNVRNSANENDLTLTIDVTASSFVKETNLVDPFKVSEYVDKLIIMAYDYHYIGSFVTGAVAPMSGAGVISEYDVETAIVEAIRKIDPKKIVLGIPLYGYEWESMGNVPRSAVIPSTGLSISNRRAEEFLEGCATCEANFNETDQEMNIIYKNMSTGFYHQIFYPEIKSMTSKLDLAEKYDLGGVALWALGYEGNTILQPLSGWNR